MFQAHRHPFWSDKPVALKNCKRFSFLVNNVEADQSNTSGSYFRRSGIHRTSVQSVSKLELVSLSGPMTHFFFRSDLMTHLLCVYFTTIKVHREQIPLALISRYGEKIRPHEYPQVIQIIGRIWEEDFAPVSNGNGNFKYLHVKWSGGESHYIHTCGY